MSTDEFQRDLLVYLQKHQGRDKQIDNTDKLTMHYLVMSKGVDTAIVDKFGLEPDLSIADDEPGKWACIKLEIIKNRHLPRPDLSKIDMRKWEIKYLIWVS